MKKKLGIIVILLVAIYLVIMPSSKKAIYEIEADPDAPFVLQDASSFMGMTPNELIEELGEPTSDETFSNGNKNYNWKYYEVDGFHGLVSLYATEFKEKKTIEMITIKYEKKRMWTITQDWLPLTFPIFTGDPQELPNIFGPNGSTFIWENSQLDIKCLFSVFRATDDPNTGIALYIWCRPDFGT